MAGSRLPEKRDWDLVPQASCAGCQPRCWEPSLQWFSVGGAPRPTATALGSWAAQSPGPQAGQGSLGAVRRWGGGVLWRKRTLLLPPPSEESSDPHPDGNSLSAVFVPNTHSGWNDRRGLINKWMGHRGGF